MRSDLGTTCTYIFPLLSSHALGRLIVIKIHLPTELTRCHMKSSSMRLLNFMYYASNLQMHQ
jgi:hypothetical protein